MSRTPSAEPTFTYLTKNTELSVTETTMSICQTITNMENGQTSSHRKGRVNGVVADTSICLSCHESLVWCGLCLLEGQFIAEVTEQCQVWSREKASGTGVLSWMWRKHGRVHSVEKSGAGGGVVSVTRAPSRKAHAAWAG